MTRSFRLTLLSILLALPLASQTLSALEFEAATVKVNKSSDPRPSREVSGGNIYLRNVTMNIL